MRNLRRFVTLGLSVVVAGALIGGVASSQEADTGGNATVETYFGLANSDALVITALGETITGSTTTARGVSDPTAAATATEVLLGPVFTGAASVDIAGAGASAEQTADGCPLTELEAIPGVGRVSVTCPSARASITDAGLPSSRGLGAEVALDASISEVLATLGLQDTLAGTTDMVFEDAINPLVESLTGNPVGDLAQDTTDTVQDVLGDILTLQTTARVVVAPSLSEVTTTDESVTAFAQAQGLRIELLPLDNSLDGSTGGLLPDDLLPGEPLVTITVGNAEARSAYNRVTGTVEEPSSSASLLTVEFGTNALTETLGIDGEPIIDIANLNQSFCVLGGTPLETCVIVAESGTDADGGAFADGLTVQLFKGLGETGAGAGDGGVQIALGRVGTGITGEPARDVPVINPPVELPRTGAAPILPLVGAGLLVAALGARRIAMSRRSV